MNDQTRETVFSTTGSRIAPYGGALAHYVADRGTKMTFFTPVEHKTRLGLLQSDTGLLHSDTALRQSDMGIPQTDISLPHSDTGMLQSYTSSGQSDKGILQTDTSLRQPDTGMRCSCTGKSYYNTCLTIKNTKI